MDLGSVFSAVSGSKAAPQSYLAVKISSQAVLAAVWKVVDGKVVIGSVGMGKVAGGGWEQLLQAADQAVSVALANETAAGVKTIFAVPFDWVVAGKIEPGHQHDLRRLCKELDLFPQGFVVINEALENFYKETEGAPLTAILVGVDGASSFLTVYRAGRDLGTTKLEISSGNVAAAIESVLKKADQGEVLPSRIIVYDGTDNLGGIAEKLTAYPWTKQLPFLHFPKVEVASAEMVVKAVAVAGGVQLGGKFDLEPKGEEPPAGEPGLSAPSELEEISLEEAGFSTAAPVAGAAFGQLQEMSPSPGKVPAKVGLPALPFDPSAITVRLGSFLKLASPKLQPLFARLTALGGKYLPNRSSRLAVVAALLFVLLGLAALVYVVPTTTAIIKVTPKPFEKETEVIVVTDSANAVSTSSAVLVGSFVDVSEIGTKKGVASGKKLVGDKAKGSVTIYSATDARTFPAGTTLTGPDGLKFTLDSDTPVASGSGPASPATATAAVTASDIGDKYNLAAGTLFTIGNLASTSYNAKNSSVLAGGSSHQATVVTKEDQDRLLATLSAELAEKAKADLQAKIPSDQSLLPNAITANVAKKKFSRDVDAEADTVSLDLTVDYRGVVFSQADLVAIFVQKFASDIPVGFVLSPDTAEISVKTAKRDKSGNSILLIHLAGQLLPAIDKTDLAVKLTGKSLVAATTIIDGLPSVSQVSFVTKPRLLEPVTKLFLPWKKENVKVEIVVE